MDWRLLLLKKNLIYCPELVDHYNNYYSRDGTSSTIGSRKISGRGDMGAMARVRGMLLLCVCLWLGITNASADSHLITPTVADVAYGNCLQATPAGELNQCVVDLYEPSGDALGVLVFVHGGGWTSGDKRNIMSAQAMLRSYLNRGFLVAAVNFRLSTLSGADPQVTYAESVTDIARALAWLRDNGAAYGLNQFKPVLVGYSSGAHLVALVLTDHSYLQSEALSSVDIDAVISLDVHAYDVPYALTLMVGSVVEPNIPTLEWLFGQTEVEQNVASPSYYVTTIGGYVPPSLLITADSRDPVIQNSELVNSHGYVSFHGTDRYWGDLTFAGHDATHEHFDDETHRSLVSDFGVPGDGPTEAFKAFLDRLDLPSAPPAVVHVSDLDGVVLSEGKNWRAKTTVTVEDENHTSLPYATVGGTWSGGFSGTDACITGGDGACILISGNIPKKTDSATFTVDDVSRWSSSFAYDSGANHDDEGDSSGTVIQVHKDGSTSFPGNEAPVASFIYDCNGFVCDLVGSDSNDNDGVIVDYSWDFGDTQSGIGETVSHTYAQDGTYIVTLTVTDDAGETGTDALSVTIGAVNATMHVTDLEGLSTVVRNRWNATVTISIADDNAIAVSDVTVTGTWSDGATGSGTCVTDSVGSCSMIKKNLKTAVPSVTLTVTDMAHTLYTYNPSSNLESEVIVVAP